MTGDWQTQLSPSQAALGLRQLDVLATIRAERKAIDDYYQRELEGLVTLPPRAAHPYSHFTIRVSQRDAFRERMYRLGVECGRTLDYCLPDMDLYASQKQRGSCPEATRAAAEIVNLPNYPGLGLRAASRVVRAVKVSLRR